MPLLLKFAVSLSLISLSISSQAEAYRCKTPQGSTVYQDQPCNKGSKGEEIQLKALPNSNSGVPASTPEWRLREQQSAEQRQRKAEAEQKANDAEAPAKTERCSQAKRDLAILRQQVAAYRTNQQGERNYLDDKDRETEINNAEKVIRENCK